MFSLKMWQRIRAYVDRKVRDAYMAQYHSDTACPCCKRWGHEGAKRTWKDVDAHSSRMTCGECGAEATFNFAIAPVAILTEWRPPRTEAKAVDHGVIGSEESFFIVWNPTHSRTPSVRHARERGASVTAYEMAQTFDQGEIFYVLEAKRAFQSQGEVQQFELAVHPRRRWNGMKLGLNKRNEIVQSPLGTEKTA